MYLVYIIDNLMARCVARNPKDIVRQVAAAKELDSAKVGEVFKQLFNHVLRDFDGPRDQSHSSIGRKEAHRNSAQAM